MINRLLRAIGFALLVILVGGGILRFLYVFIWVAVDVFHGGDLAALLSILVATFISLVTIAYIFD